jgi:uncharacterized protein DUF1259
MKASRKVLWVAALVAAAAGCGEATPQANSPVAASGSASSISPSAPPAMTPPAPAPLAPAAASVAPPPHTAPVPIDAARVASITGGKPETADNVVKVTFPRDDIAVEVDGWKKLPPFLGLTSWAAFVPGEKPGVEAMVMGDLVVFEDEVNPVMSAALEGGIGVTALHNHFFFDKPRVYFMHIGGEGSVEQLAKGVRAALDAEKAIRQKNKQPVMLFGAPPPSPSKIDAAKLDGVLGVKGSAKDGMYKAVFGRKTQAQCGCTIGKAMGISTWSAFGGSDADAVVDGDFAVAEDELQPVLKALRGGGINIVAIHSHTTGESPRLLFLHYWGRGPAAGLAATVKRAVDLTAWDGKSTQT